MAMLIAMLAVGAFDLRGDGGCLRCLDLFNKTLVFFSIFINRSVIVKILVHDGGPRPTDWTTGTRVKPDLLHLVTVFLAVILRLVPTTLTDILKWIWNA